MKMIEFIEDLGGMLKDKIPVNHLGICGNIDMLLYKHEASSDEKADVLDSLYSAIRSWSKFIKNEKYPVPVPKKLALVYRSFNSGGIFIKAVDDAKRNKFKHISKSLMWGDNPYADLRRELLVHIIKEFKADYLGET